MGQYDSSIGTYLAQRPCHISFGKQADRSAQTRFVQPILFGAAKETTWKIGKMERVIGALKMDESSWPSSSITTNGGLLSCRSFPQLGRLLSKKGSSTHMLVKCVAEPSNKETAASKPLYDGRFPFISTMPTAESEYYLNTLPDIWPAVAEKYGDTIALFEPHHNPPTALTYSQLTDTILDFAEGLKIFGLKSGECVSLFSENSHRWIIADQGIMSAGAYDAVRGAKAATKELVHIVSHSESSVLVVESEELLDKITMQAAVRGSAPAKLQLKFAVVLWPRLPGGRLKRAKAQNLNDLHIPVYMYEDVLEAGRTSRDVHLAAGAYAKPKIQSSDMATLVYTSGTSGIPKAVMLTHANLMHQIRNFGNVINVTPGEVGLSLLPPWHMYERSCEYFILSAGMKLIYSGVKTFKEDLPKYTPDLFVAVPLVFDVLYNAVQKKLEAGSPVKVAVVKGLMATSQKYMAAVRSVKGMVLKKETIESEGMLKSTLEVVVAAIVALLLLPFHLLAEKLIHSQIRKAINIKHTAISGGGSLPSHVDHFFETVGINLRNGYGLTETSPVLAVRREENNVLGTVGQAIGETEIKIVNAKSGQEVPDGERGVVKARGPQVMKGYFKDPAATAAVIDSEGWFDTGDLGWLVPAKSSGSARNCSGLLVLDGRAKDTIVLANGENVEPTRVEEAALTSRFIHQIIVLGQDQRKLGALIVPFRVELDEMIAASKGCQIFSVTDEDRKEALKLELAHCCSEAGCAFHERIDSFEIVHEPFTVENGLLTPTMKMKREVIFNKYKDLCSSLFHHHF